MERVTPKVHLGNVVMLNLCVWYEELNFLTKFLLENLLNVVWFVVQIWSFGLCDGDTFNLNLINFQDKVTKWKKQESNQTD